jgi:hypothetical protein
MILGMQESPKNVCHKFVFQCGSIDVSKDDVYDDNSLVKNSIY